MGSKLEAVKRQSKDGIKSFSETKKLGQKAVADTKSIKKLIDSLPTDVDDEISNAAKAVGAGTKSDAQKYMKDTVGKELKEGKDHMKDSTETSRDQVKQNKTVKDTFTKMDSVGAFGKAAREKGRTAIDKSTEDFKKVISDNSEQVKTAEAEYQKEISDISDTF